MKFFEKDHAELKKLLVTAHNGKKNADPGDRWQRDVMNRIRSIGPLCSETNGFVLFDQFVWRFATAACFVAILLSVFVFQTGLSPEYDLAGLYIDDPMELTFVQYFGI